MKKIIGIGIGVLVITIIAIFIQNNGNVKVVSSNEIEELRESTKIKDIKKEHSIVLSKIESKNKFCFFGDDKRMKPCTQKQYVEWKDKLKIVKKEKLIKKQKEQDILIKLEMESKIIKEFPEYTDVENKTIKLFEKVNQKQVKFDLTQYGQIKHNKLFLENVVYKPIKMDLNYLRKYHDRLDEVINNIEIEDARGNKYIYKLIGKRKVAFNDHGYSYSFKNGEEYLSFYMDNVPDDFKMKFDIDGFVNQIYIKNNMGYVFDLYGKNKNYVYKYGEN